MTTELTQCSNSKRSTPDTGIIVNDQAKARLAPSPNKEFFRLTQRQRRKSSEKDEIVERSFPSSTESNPIESGPISPHKDKQKKPDDIFRLKKLKRAFSLHQESGSENENNIRLSPKQKGSKNVEKIKTESSRISLVKFGPIQLPNPNTTGEFFKQRASFHSDTSNSCAAESAKASTSGLGGQDNGIICSNSDLRSILSDATGVKKAGVDIKRERMKNYRSLSFDSSVFRIPRRGNTSEATPVWFSWNKSNPRIPETGICQQEEEKRKNIIQIRLTSQSPDDDKSVETSPEKTIKVVVEEVKSKNTGIPWDERSIVDVNVLGNAIESYLGERRASGDDGDKPNEDKIQDESLCSSLKSMFVK